VYYGIYNYASCAKILKAEHKSERRQETGDRDRRQEIEIEARRDNI